MFRALKGAPWKKAPRIPRGLRLYVVADIHGRLDALRDVFDRIDAIDCRDARAAESRCFSGTMSTVGRRHEKCWSFFSPEAETMRCCF